MKISLEWIAEYVDVSGLAPDMIAERLTMATAEVEAVETLTRSLDGVRVGKVVSVEAVSDTNAFVRVECGPDTFSTVCGAPNVRPGMTSAFAPAGVRLADGTRLEARQVAGRSSQGVLCSSEELGMGGGHVGIVDLPGSLASGRLLSELIPPTDTIIEIDNKSLTHRPDLWGHYGLAREVAAVLGRPLRPLDRADLSAYDDLPAYPLALDDVENCPCYCCLELDGVAALPAPLTIQYRLHALGQRTFNILVDLTNYIMLELAQPMHAFDGARLRAVRIAPFGRSGSFTTLDGQDRAMQPDDLMIWNETQPVALAGIMGGLNSEVGQDTTRLLLESANFRAARIRRTATRLGLQTDASQRFEKQQPPVTTKLGIERFVRLLHEAGLTPEVRSRFTCAGDLKHDTRRLSIPKDFFDRRIGNPIGGDKIVSILTSLGFEAELDAGELRVGIPPFRSEKDIALPVDILEEVTRINGYDNLEPRLPDFSADTVAFDDRLRTEHKARRLLAQAYQFSEIHNYSWFDETWLKTIGYDPPAALRVANPSAEQHVRLRTSLMPNILAVVKKNACTATSSASLSWGRAIGRWAKATARSACSCPGPASSMSVLRRWRNIFGRSKARWKPWPSSSMWAGWISCRGLRMPRRGRLRAAMSRSAALRARSAVWALWPARCSVSWPPRPRWSGLSWILALSMVRCFPRSVSAGLPLSGLVV